MNYISAEKELQAIKPNQRIFVHGGAATPHFLLKKLADRASTLWNVEIVISGLQGDPVIADKKYKDNFRINSFIVSEYGIAYLDGKNMRQRARAFIEIAHPNHREGLERSAFERLHSYEFERTIY